ncbi:MAG TPA: glycosyltransferase [Candidatus Baltobacteraceae bacterium]|nr:glycosyltransferase [Candidatus Baltobacteraceae bacterium]
MNLGLHWNESRFAEESAVLRSLDVPDGTIAIGTDFSDAGRTVARIVEARRRGETVALYAYLADPLEAIVNQVGRVLAQQPNNGSRYEQVLALRENRLNVNQKPLHENAVYDQATLRAAVLCVKLADVMLYFTQAERDRWSALIGRALRGTALLPVPQAYAQAPDTGGVSFYCPDGDTGAIDVLALALRERAVEARLTPHGSAPQTQTVVVPAWWRPARALALASAGYRVVAPMAGGAQQRAACAEYAPTDLFSVGAALDAAQTDSTDLLFDATADDVTRAVRAAIVPSKTGPRVSIVVRTFDRAVLLERALRSIAAQTYGDVEIVVVNNGGADVAGIVGRASGSRPYRYVRLDERAHISVASNAGARAASGAYIGYLDDDDLLYPDHCARTIDALERTGADLAYTNCVAEYARIDGETKTLLGFQMFRDAEFVARDLYVDNFAPIHSIVHRRDLFDRFGLFDEELPVTDDWEMWLRASRGARFVHVNHVTCEYSWRVDPARGNMTLTHQRQFRDSYERTTGRYAADVAGFALIEQRQAQVKQAQQARAQQLADLGPRIAELTLAAMSRDAVAANPPPDDPFA